MTTAIVRGDAAHLPLPDGSVDLVVTSPPYWGQRAYADAGEVYDGQIGAEATAAEYIASLLACTREWMRVLKPSGSLFVNLGDKYSTTGTPGTRPQLPGIGKAYEAQSRERRGVRRGGAPVKSLMLLPQRYAIGCADDLGLILRAEIVWAKPNGLPESVTDRVRRSHEQVFHFTKSSRYFAAVDEIRRPHQPQSVARSRRRYEAGDQFSVGSPNTLDPAQFCNPLGALPGSVWEIPSAPLKVPAELGIDHFAAYPPELVRRIILGWSPSGICTVCGEGRRPVSVADPVPAKEWALGQRDGRSWHGDGSEPTRALGATAADRNRRIAGYACACPDTSAPTRAAVVLDPFGGTGTTALVADTLGRAGITIDRSADYCRLAAWRTADPGERARVLRVPKPRPEAARQESLFGDMAVSA